MTLTQPRSTSESTSSPPWTDAAFMALPNDGHRYELVNNQLIDIGNSGALDGHICSALMILLGSYIRSQKLGLLFDSSTGFKMQNGNTRSPDLAFFAKNRLQGLTTLPTGFLEGAPDLAVEVLSPGNTVEEIDGKITEYFANGTRLMWVINPQQRYILVYRSPQEPDRLLKTADRLDGEAIIPGFSLPIAELFQELDF
ncbi:Uma2 family endonuclease [Limnothrix sp. FACHB-881]|uniref:Uma2 family endonuclease n=1 Tax=Limnothrix sp. FACHB-881 TaxID=2692819 RepID=UPI0016878554|nr:Uma2 family endonuclease [Limnothrix sp. FACHB-881]MBD2636295.1 Uma2 family endonuclease [Limnothrix sp. FACHB-881]